MDKIAAAEKALATVRRTHARHAARLKAAEECCRAAAAEALGNLGPLAAAPYH